MAEPTIVHSAFVIEQSYAAPPARLFAALSDPESKRRWYHHGENHTVGEYRMEFRVGGVEEWEATFNSDSPFPGAILASRGVILDIVPDARIVLAADMSIEQRRFSVSLITFEIAAEGGGSRLFFTHQGAFFEGSDGPERREEGWRKLLARLKLEVERVAAEA